MRQGGLQLLVFYSFVNEQVEVWHLLQGRKMKSLSTLFIQKKKSQAIC